jgi:hypothetical protein
MINSKSLTSLLALLATCLFLSGCRAKSNSQLKDAVDVTKPKFCAAVRGNGQYIFTHFGSLARITEEYGILDGIAGGSSGSLTAFIYESMRMNPILNKYSGAEKELKLALMLKSMLGYLDTLKGTDEFIALAGMQVFGEAMNDKGLETLESDDADRAKSTLNVILADPNVRRLVNPEIFTMLSGRDNPPYKSLEFKIDEIKQAAGALTAFAANDQKILFREGLVNMKNAADMIGRIADFYALSKHVDKVAMESFLDQCGDAQSRGLDWRQVTKLDRGGKKCGKIFSDLVASYRSEHRKSNFVTPMSRLDDHLGKAIETVILSAYVENDPNAQTTAPQDFTAALKRYRNGDEPAYDVDFDNVHFGFWASEGWKTKLIAGIAQSTDAKTKKYRSVSQSALTWRDIIPLSIMEPGLSRMIPVDADRVFIGGWADLHPVQPLKAAGCDEVIYVSREGPETKFVSDPRPLTASSPKVGVAELLNLTPAQQKDLYAPDNTNSSYSRAVSTADAVWCTNWDTIGSLDFDGMFAHSYNSRIAPKTDRFKKSSVVQIVPAPLIGCY